MILKFQLKYIYLFKLCSVLCGRDRRAFFDVRRWTLRFVDGLENRATSWTENVFRVNEETFGDSDDTAEKDKELKI